ncbi:MAG: lipid A biosynthesis lauroyl acyltransferase [Gammaproteobacteria bacterium]
MPDSKKSHTYSPRHWPALLGLWLLRQAVRLPYRTQVQLGRRLGALLRRLTPRHERIAYTNIRLCFPALSEAECRARTRAHFEALGISLFEVGMSWWASEEFLRPLMKIKGKENLDEALEHGRGVLLLSAHFTTLEIGGRLISLLHPIDVTYRPGRDDPVGEHLTRQRDRLYESAIPKENVRAVLRRLKENKIIWYAPDQGYGGPNRVYVDFFGIPAASNPATARFAKISGAKVVPFFARRLPEQQGYELNFLPALEQFPSDDIVADTRRVNETFEKMIQRAPEQYLWVHKRFKFAPPGQSAPY